MLDLDGEIALPHVESWPVCEFNVLLSVTQHLPGEIKAVDAKILELEGQLSDLRHYAEVLRRVEKAVQP